MDFAQPAQIERLQQSQKIVLKSGPDFEEGPHSQIGEDEFYDAVENALDKFEEELEFRDKLKEMSLKQLEDTIEEDSKKHSLWLEIDEVNLIEYHECRFKTIKAEIFLTSSKGNQATTTLCKTASWTGWRLGAFRRGRGDADVQKGRGGRWNGCGSTKGTSSSSR